MSGVGKRKKKLGICGKKESKRATSVSETEGEDRSGRRKFKMGSSTRTWSDKKNVVDDPKGEKSGTRQVQLLVVSRNQ